MTFSIWLVDYLSILDIFDSLNPRTGLRVRSTDPAMAFLVRENVPNAFPHVSGHIWPVQTKVFTYYSFQNYCMTLHQSYCAS